MNPCDLWMHVEPELEFLVTSDTSDWTQDQHDMAGDWNDNVPSRYPRTSVADLRDFHENYPEFVPRQFLETMMYNLRTWFHVRETYEHINSTLCYKFTVGPGGVTANSGESSNIASSDSTSAQRNSTSTVQRRFIQPDIDGTDDGQSVRDPFMVVPNLTTILEGIEQGMSQSCTTIFCLIVFQVI
jgi:hypothetical protein